MEEESSSGGWVWEVGHAVGAHALGECQPGLPAAGAPGPELAPAPVAVLDPAVLDPAVLAEPALVELGAGVLAPSSVAAVGLCELPPHPATRSPLDECCDGEQARSP